MLVCLLQYFHRLFISSRFFALRLLECFCILYLPPSEWALRTSFRVLSLLFGDRLLHFVFSNIFYLHLLSIRFVHNSNCTLYTVHRNQAHTHETRNTNLVFRYHQQLNCSWMPFTIIFSVDGFFCMLVPFSFLFFFYSSTFLSSVHFSTILLFHFWVSLTFISPFAYSLMQDGCAIVKWMVGRRESKIPEKLRIVNILFSLHFLYRMSRRIRCPNVITKSAKRSAKMFKMIEILHYISLDSGSIAHSFHDKHEYLTTALHEPDKLRVRR